MWPYTAVKPHNTISTKVFLIKIPIFFRVKIASPRNPVDTGLKLSEREAGHSHSSYGEQLGNSNKFTFTFS
jgi:hypothetical protein